MKLPHIPIQILALALVSVSCSPSDKDWQDATKENTKEGYENYVRQNPLGSHLDEAAMRIESIEWSTALARRDESMLRACIERYPKSKNVEQANEELWNIRWKPVAVEKADSIAIYDSEKRVIMGSMGFEYKTLMSGQMKTEPIGDVIVYVWRDFATSDKEIAKKLGLRTGLAYLKTKTGEFKYIRKVDLALSNEQLALGFGIHAK